MDGRDVRRGGGAVLISLLGAGVLVPNVARLATLRGPPAELGLAGLGAVLALVLVAAGAVVAWHESTRDYTLRIAGWAVLGTVVLALVLALIVAAGVALPLPAAATLLSVSTFAHVLIGVRDVQRIRAEDVARRMDFSLRCALAHGTGALRTHLDSIGAQTAITWPVFAEMRESWRGTIALQAVSLIPLDIVHDDEAADEALTRVLPALVLDLLTAGMFLLFAVLLYTELT